MPKRTDLQSILILGSGPIPIGQAAEFDYSGHRRCARSAKRGQAMFLTRSCAQVSCDSIVGDPYSTRMLGWTCASYDHRLR
jgi:hypothetical protein